MPIYVPIKQQSQTTKEQRVENMIGDLWLLSYSSVLESQAGFHWLTTVSKYKHCQHRKINDHWRLKQKSHSWLRSTRLKWVFHKSLT